MCKSSVSASGNSKTPFVIAMNGSTPFLTDTVRVMPTDIFMYLPLVLKGP